MGKTWYPLAGIVQKNTKKIIKPLFWKSTEISVSEDLFDQLPEQWVDAVFAVMGMTYDEIVGEDGSVRDYKQRHDYLLLTEHPKRMHEYIHNICEMNWEELRRRFFHMAYRMCVHKEKADCPWYKNASMAVATWVKNGMPGFCAGAIIKNQTEVEERIPILLDIPVEKHFVRMNISGPVNLSFSVQVDHEQNEGHIKELD